VRAAVPKSFCVGIKLNSADHQHAKSLEETLEQISYIVDAGIDFLEISGGTYEDPQVSFRLAAYSIRELTYCQMMQVKKQAPSAKTSAREAFFLDFAKAVRARFPDVKLMVTGGFRTRGGMEAALAENVCDIIGLGRPSIINQSFPKEVVLNDKVSNQVAQMNLAPVALLWLLSWVPIKVLGAGAETVSSIYLTLQH
jgi:2,4-dienoyl-CoA reductase-like NADH-dependent reductase (Old Yellow Enzyme family)